MSLHAMSRYADPFWDTGFGRHEFACKCGCGFDVVDVELLAVLEYVRDHFERRPVIITSGCRCEMHNKTVGGSPRSQHLLGKAADFKVVGVHPDAVADWLEQEFPGKYGIGRYDGRTHVDVRGWKARWDRRGEG
jgi:uncharacterized protein YcbK (DUF882 family)